MNMSTFCVPASQTVMGRKESKAQINADNAPASLDPAQSDQVDPATNSAPTLPIRTPTRPKRLHREGSAVSVASRKSASKRARVRPGVSSRSSSNNVSPNHLEVPAQDDSAITSGEETADSVLGDTPIKITPQSRPEPPLLRKPAWTVRHRVYLDNALLSCTTSIQRPSVHNFSDFLLREQIETRLNTAHDGREAHFATRHAILRFWKRDGSLAEKWMDKDFADEEREHEFALENLNDWTILNLSMGAEEQRLEDEEDDSASEGAQEDTNMEDSSGNIIVEDTDADTSLTVDQSEAQDDKTEEDSSVLPTMDITSHYLSSYYDARRIASAPAHSSQSDDPQSDNEDETEDKTATYHWVEERRRNLETQFQDRFACTTATCPNNGGICISLTKPSTQPQQPQQSAHPFLPRRPSAQSHNSHSSIHSLTSLASLASISSPHSQQQHQDQSEIHHIAVMPKDITDWSQQIAHANRSIAATTLHLVAKLIDDETREEDRRLAEDGRERDDEDDLGSVLQRVGALKGLMPQAGN